MAVVEGLLIAVVVSPRRAPEHSTALARPCELGHSKIRHPPPAPARRIGPPSVPSSSQSDRACCRSMRSVLAPVAIP